MAPKTGPIGVDNTIRPQTASIDDDLTQHQSSPLLGELELLVVVRADSITDSKSALDIVKSSLENTDTPEHIVIVP